MNIDRDLEPARPAPDRDAGRDRDPDRHGHRREYDAKHPRRDFSERVDGVVRDVAAFRVVALADLITHKFDGHPFAGRREIGEAEQRGWIERQTAHGPKGGRFTVLVATPAGAAGLWATEGRASQRVFSGAVKTADMRHDVAVYHAAAELDLPMVRGKVLFPDAQIEYVTAAGVGRRCNVEVASEHYGGGDIRAKAAVGSRQRSGMCGGEGTGSGRPGSLLTLAPHRSGRAGVGIDPGRAHR